MTGKCLAALNEDRAYERAVTFVELVGHSFLACETRLHQATKCSELERIRSSSLKTCNSALQCKFFEYWLANGLRLVQLPQSHTRSIMRSTCRELE